MKNRQNIFSQTSLYYVSSIIVLFLWAKARFISPGLERHWFIAILSAFTAFLGALVFKKSGFQKKAEHFLNLKLGWMTSLTTIAIILFFLTLYCGMRQFGAFDCSALIDGAWRAYQGQMPYRDFPCTLPPGFFLGAGLAFKIFGPRWFSLVLMDALYGSATFIWSCWLLKKLVRSRLMALLLASVLQTSTTLLVAFWWYNPITTIAGVLFGLSAIHLLSASKNYSALFSYSSSLILLSLMKPNIAGPEIIGISTIVFLFSSKKDIFKLLFLSCSAFGVFLGILHLGKLDLTHLVTSYLGISGRAFTFHQFLQDTGIFEQRLVLTLWGILFLLLITLFAKHIDFKNPKKWIAVVLLGAGIFGSIVNGENKLVDLPLIIFGIWFLIDENKFFHTSILRLGFSYYQVLVFLFSFLIGLGCGEALMRNRVMGIGPFFEFETSEKPIAGSFFQGMSASPSFFQLHKELVSLISSLSKTNSIWFGPRLQWAYADFNVASPIDQPIWWDKGVSYSPKEENHFVTAWEESHFKILVFFLSDTTYLPPELLAYIRKNYFLIKKDGLLTILCQKNL